LISFIFFAELKRRKQKQKTHQQKEIFFSSHLLKELVAQQEDFVGGVIGWQFQNSVGKREGVNKGFFFFFSSFFSNLPDNFLMCIEIGQQNLIS
jgi:hypothetical protein